MAENRSFEPTTPQANRAAEQGLGVGRKEMDRQRDPGGETVLGEGAPAGLDIHDAGQDDKPEQDWGEPAGEDAAYSANHTRRPVKTEADRGQGKKTRQAQKDQINRRP